MPKIVEMDNLREAFLRAAKGKHGRRSVVDFRDKLEENLLCLRQGLLDGTWQFDDYHFFTIYDPKERLICAAPFPQRVVFHAMMRICHNVFDNYQIDDSYASRVGLGQYKALERTSYFCRKYRWFAKIDVCRYFDSISHDIMFGQLQRLFKEKLLLLHFRKLLDSYRKPMGKGLPIGNLTSQYFANHYLAVADHYAKATVKVPAVVRYMDDVIMFGNSKTELLKKLYKYNDFLNSTLHLDTHPPVVNNTNRGVPYLGYVVYDNQMRLNLRSKRRLKRKLAMLNNMLQNDIIGQDEYVDRTNCLFAFANKANIEGYKRLLSSANGVYP